MGDMPKGLSVDPARSGRSSREAPAEVELAREEATAGGSRSELAEVAERTDCAEQIKSPRRAAESGGGESEFEGLVGR